MNPDLQAPVVAVTGFVAVRLVVGDGYLAYLKPGMRYPLLAAGVVLVVLGLAGFARWWRRVGRGEEGAAAADGRHRVPVVAWFLLLPVLALILIGPAPLGTDAVDRGGASGGGVRAVTSSGAVAGSLPAPVDGAVELTMTDFLARATLDRSRSLDGVAVRLTGFVDGPDPAGTFRLTRFALVCCAADAFALQVEVREAPVPVPAPDTWVQVEGRWAAEADGATSEADDPVVLVATAVREVPAPANPYE